MERGFVEEQKLSIPVGRSKDPVKDPVGRTRGVGAAPVGGASSSRSARTSAVATGGAAVGGVRAPSHGQKRA